MSFIICFRHFVFSFAPLDVNISHSALSSGGCFNNEVWNNNLNDNIICYTRVYAKKYSLHPHIFEFFSMAKLTFLCIFADTFTEGLIFLFLLNDILLLFEHRFLWLYFIFDTEMVKKISNEWNFLRMSLKTTLRKKYQIKFNSLKIILKFYLKLNFNSK